MTIETVAHDSKVRAERVLRMHVNYNVLGLKIASRFVEGLMPGFAESLLNKAIDKERKYGNLTPDAKTLLTEFKAGKYPRSGEIFHFVTKPLDEKGRFVAAQLLYDAREQFRDSKRGFTYIKDKIGTIFSGSNTPPLKPA